MTLVSKNIPNLINGVSQQPPALRLASQAEAQENGFSDIVDGLKKRPPTQLKNKLKKTSPTGNTFLSATEINRSHFHTYKRSTFEQYTVVTDPVAPKMYVYDINGSLRYESGVASWDATGTQITANSDNTAIAAYLGTDAIDSTQVTATSVADYTFFVNKDKVVAKNTTTPSFARPYEALFYMKIMNYGKVYRWWVLRDDDPLTATDDTWSGIYGQGETRDGTGNDAVHEVQGLRTGRFFDITADNEGVNDSVLANKRWIDAQTLDNPESLAEEGLTKNRDTGDPFVVIETTDANAADFKIKVEDNNGGNDLFGFKDKCKNFISLPEYCVEGFTIQVNGDNQKKEDDFYVTYEGANTAGTWKECAAPSRPNIPVYHEFDNTTMPHTLSQNADLSFTFGTSTWDERKCGDEDTNPFPSFVGSKINSVFFHRNRLGFLADENVIFSEASSYFNFFRVTVRSLLDTAPIDLAVSQNEVSILKAAVPAQDDLILFSDLTQFTLSADSLLTPSEVIVDQSTKYECDLTSTPVGAGTSVFFTTKSGDYSGVREFFTKDETENKDAPSITSHVPEYLNGTVRQMIASSNEDMLVCLTETDKKECYVYKWYNSSEERIQSSWSKWIFSKDIAHMFFNNATLTIIFSDGSYEEMSLSTSQSTTSYLEDSSTTITGTSNSFTDGMYGYINISKGYNSNLNFGSSDSANIQQAYTRLSTLNGILSSRIVHVRALKTLFAGLSLYTDASLPVSIKITNNTTGYAFTRPVFANSGNPQYFNATHHVANNFVDFRVDVSSAENAGLFTSGVFAVEFIYADTVVSVDSSTQVVHLDHSKVLTGLPNLAALQAVYNPTVNSQYVDHKGNLVASGSPADGSALYTYLLGTHTTTEGTQANYVYAGEAYNFKYKFSEQVFKAGDNDPTRLARYQLRSMSLNYNDTGSFDVTVASTGRTEKVTGFTGRILAQADNILGYSPVVEDGTLKVGIQSQAKETDITITNNSHLPSTFQNAEVEAFVTLRNKRI
tara:strand:+ start:523 stop:3552 length:3030 start_codon:yes stop_codon:yes gene_type:complete